MMKDIWSYQIYEDLKALPDRLALYGITKKSMDFYCEAKSKGLHIDFIVDTDGLCVKADGNEKLDSNISKIRNDYVRVISINALKSLNHVNLLFVEDLSEDDRIILGNSSIHYINCGDKKLRNELTAGGKVYIYGAGLRGRKTVKILCERNVDMQGFIDSDASKCGNIISGYRVCSISEVPKNVVIIISAEPYKEIYNYLIRNGIDEQYIYVDAANSLFFREKPLIYREFYDSSDTAF